jgi:hypothetical protein
LSHHSPFSNQITCQHGRLEINCQLCCRHCTRFVSFGERSIPEQFADWLTAKEPTRTAELDDKIQAAKTVSDFALADKYERELEELMTSYADTFRASRAA